MLYYNETMHKEKTRPKLGCLWSLLSVFVLLLILSPFILRSIGGLLVYADPLEKADTAVALSGDTGDRISEAIWLYKNQFVDGLFITYTEDTARDALVNAAVQQGIPAERIHETLTRVDNTVDEAQAVRFLAAERAQDSLIIITDPFHTLRTRIIFRNELRGSGIKVQVRPVSEHWYSSRSWWKSKEGINLTIQEYIKILFYHFGKY